MFVVILIALILAVLILCIVNLVKQANSTRDLKDRYETGVSTRSRIFSGLFTSNKHRIELLELKIEKIEKKLEDK